MGVQGMVLAEGLSWNSDHCFQVTASHEPTAVSCFVLFCLDGEDGSSTEKGSRSCGGVLFPLNCPQYSHCGVWSLMFNISILTSEVTEKLILAASSCCTLLAAGTGGWPQQGSLNVQSAPTAIRAQVPSPGHPSLGPEEAGGRSPYR